ncbi:MAG: 4Fe-4S binding protein [Lawsonibacter sp.]
MLKLSPEEKKALKGRGIILNRDKETFIARIITEDSTLTSEQLEWIAQAARQFGSGSVAMTVRMTVEVQGIPYENIEPFTQFLEAHGLYTGGTGARVRPIVPCKGTVCVHGLIDTQQLARELHETFYKGWYDVTLPHKFKIGIGGCPNNCVKPGLNDFGIMGQRVPHYDPQLCKSCKRCNVEVNCPMKICTKGEDGKMVCRTELCTSCGKCIDACPFHAVEEAAAGYKIMLGGIWGKRQRMATVLDGVYQKEELVKILEKTLTLWKEQGKAGERFGLFLDRIGPENFVEQLKKEA